MKTSENLKILNQLKINNLKTSAFLSGAFPAEYGNVVGAVFDLELRDGNPNKFEFLGQVGFNGFDAGIEGPLKIGKNASFLINYRYSTLGLVNSLGLDLGTGFAVPPVPPFPVPRDRLWHLYHSIAVCWRLPRSSCGRGNR